MTTLLSNNLLSVILWLPLVGAVAIALIPKRLEHQAKVAGLFVSLATFVVSIGILQRFDSAEAGFQMVEHSSWIPAWGISYALGIDGISLWLTLLTTFLTPLVLLSAWNSVHKHVNAYVVAMLALEFGMIGSFLATDLLP